MYFLLCFWHVCNSKQMLHFPFFWGREVQPDTPPPPLQPVSLSVLKSVALYRHDRLVCHPFSWPIIRFKPLDNFPTRSFCVSSFDLSLSSRPCAAHVSALTSCHSPLSILHSPLSTFLPSLAEQLHENYNGFIAARANISNNRLVNTAGSILSSTVVSSVVVWDRIVARSQPDQIASHRIGAGQLHLQITLGTNFPCDR